MKILLLISILFFPIVAYCNIKETKEIETEIKPNISISQSMSLALKFIKKKKINIKRNFLQKVEYKYNFKKPSKSYWELYYKNKQPFVEGGFFILKVINSGNIILEYGE
jgi:hypothetical protein